MNGGKIACCIAGSDGSFHSCKGSVDEVVLEQRCLVFRILAFDFLPLLKSELPSPSLDRLSFSVLIAGPLLGLSFLECVDTVSVLKMKLKLQNGIKGTCTLFRSKSAFHRLAVFQGIDVVLNVTLPFRFILELIHPLAGWQL